MATEAGMTAEEEFRLNGEIAAIKAVLALTFASLAELPETRELAELIHRGATNWSRDVRDGVTPSYLNDIGSKASEETLSFIFSGLASGRSELS